MVANPETKTPTAFVEATWVDGEEENSPLIIDFRPILELMARLEYSERDIDRWLIEFNHANHELVGKLELDAGGALLATPMPSVAGSRHETDFLVDLANWAADFGGNAHGARLLWALRISSGVGEGVHHSVVQVDGKFLRIGADRGQ